MDNLFTLIGTLAAILGVIIILRSIADGSGDLMWVAWICAVVVLFSYAVVNHPGTLVWSFVDHAENDKITIAIYNDGDDGFVVEIYGRRVSEKSKDAIFQRLRYLPELRTFWNMISINELVLDPGKGTQQLLDGNKEDIKFRSAISSDELNARIRAYNSSQSQD